MRVLAVAFCLMVLGACSNVTITPIKDTEPLPVPQGVKPQVIALNKIKSVIPRGRETIGQGPNSFWDILSCEMPWGSVQSTSIGSYIVMGNIRMGFADTLERLGYDVAGNPGLLFNEDEDMMRTRYRIGARIVDSSISMCLQDNLLQLDTRTKGEANVEIEWVIYDGLLKKTVYKTRTKGYGKIPVAQSEGAAMLLESAFESATHHLGTDRVFHDLIFNGIAPNQSDADFGIDRERYPPEDWGKDISLKNHKPFGKNFQSMQRATVLVENGAGGHGSGFFITDKHILTNAHVVGFADTLRVTLSGKTDYQLAKVIRTDRPRDVAVLELVKPVTNTSLYTIAPINTRKTAVGDNVYVIGAPYYKRLQDTVVKGIISGHRYDKQVRQTYIQSDALIHGGNSGGPMFNTKGEVIGLSVAGFANKNGEPLAGLNWFIPIADALKKLNINI